MHKFRALKTFESEETRSTYVTGLFYTIRPGNDLLAVLAEDWVSEGKIEYVDGTGVMIPSRVTGQGVILPEKEK